MKNLSAMLAVNRFLIKKTTTKKTYALFCMFFSCTGLCFQILGICKKLQFLLEIRETKSTDLLCSRLLLSSLLLSPSALVSSHRFIHVLSVAELSELVAETGH